MKSVVLSLTVIFALSAISTATAEDARVKRGEYIMRAADCVACHADNKGTPLAGGYAIGTPFGKVYSANISSSKQFGIGNWTEQEFSDAVRNGIGKGGKRLYPAMPYDAYHNMTDADASALFAYLQTTKPVDRAPPETKLMFPFNVRMMMIAWNILNMPASMDMSGHDNDPVWRGRYLVDVLGHCGACHTPRGFTMGMDKTHDLGGSGAGGWFAPNITSDRISGIGGWSDHDIASYLKTGVAPGKASAAGDMAEVVEDSTRYITDDDMDAIVKYLRTVPAISDPAQTQPRYTYGGVVHTRYNINKGVAAEFFRDVETHEQKASTITYDPSNHSTLDGAELYNSACASCHQPTGSGIEGQYYPSLAKHSVVGTINPRNLVLTVLNGVKRRSGEVPALMPGYADDMSDDQVVAVSNYVLQRWGNPDAKVTQMMVADLRVMKSIYSTTLLLSLVWSAMVGVVAIILFVIYRLFFRRKKKAKAV